MAYKPWPTADQQHDNQGQTDVVGTIALNPATGQPYDAANPMPVEATLTPPANQRVSAQSGDFVDGAITTLGTEADPAVTNAASTATGMAFLKGFVKILADVWDSVNHRLHVSVDNANANGQATMANSSPVVLASDEIVPIKRNCAAIYTLASTQTSGSIQNSGDLPVGAYTEISLDINTTAQAGTSPTLQLFWERKGADGIYYVLWQSNVLTAATNTLSTSIGAGMAYNQSLGLTGRLRWVVGGSATPTYTFSANVYGK